MMSPAAYASSARSSTALKVIYNVDRNGLVGDAIYNEGTKVLSGTDNTAAWVALLQRIAATGGRAEIVFGTGGYIIGAHQPVAGLASVAVKGRGQFLTFIYSKRGSVDYIRPDASVAPLAYATTPLRFDGCPYVHIENLTVDAIDQANAAIDAPWVSLAYPGTPAHSTSMRVIDSSHTHTGDVLTFGTVEGSSAGTENLTVGTIPNSQLINLDFTGYGYTDSRHNWLLTTDSAQFGVDQHTATGGSGIDVRNCTKLSMSFVRVTRTFQNGLDIWLCPMVTLNKCIIDQNGMQGGFGHTLEYPWVGYCIGGYSVGTLLIDGCLIEESSGHAVMFRVLTSQLLLGGAVAPDYDVDIRAVNSVIRGHGTYHWVKGNGSGINIVNANKLVHTKRVEITNCQITNCVDGPIWLLVPDGEVEIGGNTIDGSWGPLIAGSWKSFNVHHNKGTGGTIGLSLTSNGASGDFAPPTGNVDVIDGTIDHNVFIGQTRHGIYIGNDLTGKPLYNPRRMSIDHNTIRGAGLAAIFAEQIDGVMDFGDNILRNNNKLGVATTTVTVAGPTAPDSSTTFNFTLKVADTSTITGGNYFKAAAVAPNENYRVVDVVDANTLVMIKNRTPLAATLADGIITNAGAGDSLVFSTTGAAIGDTFTFGADTTVYTVSAVAGTTVTFSTHLSAGTISGAPIAAGTVVNHINWSVPSVSLPIGAVITAAFPVRGAIHIQGKRPFSTTLVGTPPYTVVGATDVVTVAALGTIRYGIFANDIISFGTDTSRYQVMSINTSTLALTLDRHLDASTIAAGVMVNGGVVNLLNAYPAREVNIHGGIIGDNDVDPSSTTTGVWFENANGALNVSGVAFSRIREAGVEFTDCTPRNGNLGSSVEDCKFLNCGQNTGATFKRAAVYISAVDAIATSEGIHVKRNRVIDDQGGAGPTLQYGMVLDGPGVGGGVASDNDFGAVAVGAWGQTGTGITAGVWQAWTRERNLHPWFMPNNNDVDILEEWLSGIATTGQLGTHGWSFAGTVIRTVSALGRPGAIRVSNFSGSTFGLVKLSSTTNLPFDAAEGWDITNLVRPMTADGVHRVGVMDNGAVAAVVNGAYFEHLFNDTNWFAVTANAGTRSRVDTGVPYSVAGTTTYAMRVRRIVRNNVPTAQFWIAKLGAANKAFLEKTDNMPVTGVFLDAIPLVTEDTGATGVKNGEVERTHLVLHGMAR